MGSQPAFRTQKPLGLGLNFSNITSPTDFDPGLINDLNPRSSVGKLQRNVGDSSGLSSTNCPIDVLPCAWAIKFDGDLQDAIEALDKDVTAQKKAKSDFLEEVLTTAWDKRIEIDKAIAKSIRESLFNSEVTVGKSKTSVKNVAFEGGGARVGQKALLAGFGAFRDEAKKAADPHVQKLLRQITTYSNLGSWVNKNRWVIFGAVIVVGAAGTAYVVIDNTIGAERAVDMLVANKEFDLSKFRTKEIGKLDVGAAAISAGLSNLKFKESIHDWKVEGFLAADYQISQKLSGKHKFNLHVDSKGKADVVPEFSLAYSWGAPSITASAKKGAGTDYGITIGLEYKPSETTKIFLQREWSQRDGSFNRTVLGGWEFTLPQ